MPYVWLDFLNESLKSIAIERYKNQVPDESAVSDDVFIQYDTVGKNKENIIGLMGN